MPKGPERQQDDLPVRLVTLQTTYGEVSRDCAWCGTPMRQVHLQHERWGKRLIVRTENLPGYKCLDVDEGGCGVKEPDGKATVEFLSKAIGILRYDRDWYTVGFLKEELKNVRRHLAAHAVYSRDEKGRFARATDI